MSWCQSNHVDYLFGLARNKRLRRIIGVHMHQAQVLHQSSGKAARVFAEFSYRTRKSWSCTRRVVAKAEYLDKGENPNRSNIDCAHTEISTREKTRLTHLYLWCAHHGRTLAGASPAASRSQRAKRSTTA
jgi:hypothetical protein